MSTDSQLNWQDHPTRVSAVQFPDDVIDHDENKQEVFYPVLSFVVFWLHFQIHTHSVQKKCCLTVEHLKKKQKF